MRNLLPKDFGTEDLLVVLLLLLMAGENQEDQNTALLTLALYLFLSRSQPPASAAWFAELWFSQSLPF